MAGFFPLGLLLGMLGSLVIIWHYHTDAEPRTIGLHFLGMSAGFVLATQIAGPKLSYVPLRTLAIGATALAVLALVALSFVAPPSAAIWRIGLLTVVGAAAGGLTYSLLHANQRRFEESPASSANHASALFVGGALLATVVAGVTYFGGSAKSQTFLLASVPAAYLAILVLNRTPFARHAAKPDDEDPMRGSLEDLHRIAALLFSLVILFQFVCEWAIAGWMPLFLIHKLGTNPVTSLWALALYFLALMCGRLMVQFPLPLVSHKKILLGSVALAMAGYLLLSLTSFTGLAFVAAAGIGLGQAPIYPLVAERLHDRLSYHPRLYNRSIFTAIAAAMATPWLLGYVAEAFGMAAVMLIPSVATIAVLILAILIMLESRLMGGKRDDFPYGLMASDK
jgi:FHS family glucose/mannose:H+ symporter-like MFS transporter